MNTVLPKIQYRGELVRNGVKYRKCSKYTLNKLALSLANKVVYFVNQSHYTGFGAKKQQLVQFNPGSPNNRRFFDTFVPKSVCGG